LFLCYVDESGFNGRNFDKSQPVQTMVGIFPNLYHFHKSDNEFKNIFDIIHAKIPIKEIKASEIYRGKGSWKKIKPEIRDKVIEYYLKWLSSRNHKVIVTAVDNRLFFELKSQGKYNEYFKHIPFPWLLSSLHISLVVQKVNRKIKNNKGKTLLVFDEENTFEDDLAELIYSPPSFIDEFVPFDERFEKYRLNQIIDSAYFVKSHHSSMAQVADVLAFLFRLHLELSYYGKKEAYEGEKEKISNWIDKVKGKFVKFSTIYPNKKSPFIRFLNETRAKGVYW